MNHATHKKLARRKRRIQRRLAQRHRKDQPRPMLAASNISYELADRDQAIGCGGIGMIHLLTRRVGLAELINLRVPLPPAKKTGVSPNAKTCLLVPATFNRRR